MRYDPKAKKKKLTLSRQDKAFLKMIALAFGLLATVVVLDQLGIL